MPESASEGINTAGGAVDREPVLHFGDPELEYERVRTGAALARVSERALLRMSGEDRVRFLQGMVTCDVQGIPTGNQGYGYFTTGQGKVLSDVVVLASEESLDLVVPSEMAGPLIEHLKKYIIMDRVEVRRRDREALLMIGPGVGAVLRQAGVDLPQDGETSHGTVRFEDVSLDWMFDSRRGVSAHVFWVAREQRERLARRLLEESPLVEVGELALERVRVESGIPRFGREFDAETLPQEIGDESAVSYTKGCYLGQEVVARIHYRGKVNRCLRGLLLPGEPVGGGTELLALEEDRVVGTIGTSVESPKAEGTIGLGLLHLRGGDVGDRVRLPNGDEVEIVELPFSFAV